MAFGSVRCLVVSRASSLLRASGARRTSSCSSLKFSANVIRNCPVRITRTSAITSADCLRGEQWTFRSSGLRPYATKKLAGLDAEKSLAPVRTGRGVAAARGTARSGSAAAEARAGKQDAEVEGQEEVDEWKSRNQSKRDAKRARQWGVEMATFAPAQLRQAVKWAGLSEEVYDAVIIVKNLGSQSKVRNGRRRQYTYIGGLLRNVDPNLMEPVLKATKDGDVEGIMLNSRVLPDPSDLDDTENWAEDADEEDVDEEDADEEDEAKLVTERWLHGFLNGVLSLEDEVYSIYDVDFDRQELRKLVRDAQQSTVVADSSTTSDSPEVDGVDFPISLSDTETKSQKKLRQFLMNIARQRVENQTYSP